MPTKQSNAQEETMKGHYGLVYSLDDGGWYAELWWQDHQAGPVVATKEAARKWARENGGQFEHTY